MSKIIVTACKDDPTLVRCPRCWRWQPSRANYEGICDRCIGVLLEDHPTHPVTLELKARAVMKTLALEGL